MFLNSLLCFPKIYECSKTKNHIHKMNFTPCHLARYLTSDQKDISSHLIIFPSNCWNKNWAGNKNYEINLQWCGHSGVINDFHSYKLTSFPVFHLGPTVPHLQIVPACPSCTHWLCWDDMYSDFLWLWRLQFFLQNAWSLPCTSCGD